VWSTVTGIWWFTEIWSLRIYYWTPNVMSRLRILAWATSCVMDTFSKPVVEALTMQLLRFEILWFVMKWNTQWWLLFLLLLRTCVYVCVYIVSSDFVFLGDTLWFFTGYLREIVCWTWSGCLELWCNFICSSLWHSSFWWWKHP